MIRKYPQAVFVVLFPYVLLFVFYCILHSEFVNMLFKDSTDVLYVPVAAYISAFLGAVSVPVISLKKKADGAAICRLNLFVKLLHIPAYVLFFLMAMLCLTTIFTFTVSIVFAAADLAMISVSGIIGLAAVIGSAKEKKISGVAAVFHGVLQFMFCLDIISAVILYRKNEKREKRVYGKSSIDYD